MPTKRNSITKKRKHVISFGGDGSGNRLASLEPRSDAGEGVPSARGPPGIQRRLRYADLVERGRSRSQFASPLQIGSTKEGLPDRPTDRSKWQNVGRGRRAGLARQPPGRTEAYTRTRNADPADRARPQAQSAKLSQPENETGRSRKGATRSFFSSPPRSEKTDETNPYRLSTIKARSSQKLA